MTTGTKQGQDWEEILAEAGMPAVLPEEDLEQESDICRCDALIELLSEAGISTEEFFASVQGNPDGLIAWAESQIGTIM